MKAVEISPEFGIEHLRISERSEPAPGSGEVKMRVEAVSLNFRDLGTVKGINYPDIELPRIPCSDGAGVVVEVGPGVSGVRVGDRVSALFMPAWIDGHLTPEKAASSQGGLADGMAAEHRVLPTEAVVPIPDHLSTEEGATLPCAALTAWNALFENRELSPHDTVLVRGTGGVAMFAFLFAKAHGCRVLTTSSSEHKRDRLKQLGADGVCDYRRENWIEWARAETAGEGVDVIVDSVGGATLNESLEAAKLGGYVALMGVLGGFEAPVKTVDILRKNLHLQGIYVGSRQMTVRMNEFLAKHEIHPLISHTFDLDQVKEAFRCMDQGGHFGKIVVRL